jgi:hypothetical protein
MVKKIIRWGMELLALFGVAFHFNHVSFAQEVGLVGFSAVDATPPIGVPLGGYGSPKRKLSFPWDILGEYPYASFMLPSVGIQTPIRSKSMYIQSVDKKLVFISVDAVGLEGAFYEPLVERLGQYGLKEDEIFISATHTHSGPGTLSRNLFWELTVMDRFQQDIYDRFFESVVLSVQQAIQSAQPAHLFSTAFETMGLQSNRRGRPGHFDSEAHAIMAKSLSGEWLGALINLPIHGTALGPASLEYSSDAPGGMEIETQFLMANLNQAREFGNTAPVAVFFNGAEGDVAPSAGGVEGITQIGRSFSDQLQAALANLRPLTFTWSTQFSRLKIGKASLTVKNCATGSIRDFIPEWFKVGISGFFPRRVPVAVIKWDHMAMMTWPGEPTSTLGLTAKRIAMEAGVSEVWNLGLTNGYVAYFTTPEEFRGQTYEACSSLYKKGGGARILEEMERLVSP